MCTRRLDSVIFFPDLIRYDPARLVPGYVRPIASLTSRRDKQVLGVPLKLAFAIRVSPVPVDTF